jgi:SAM-dependent methyltransferase
MSDVLRYGLYTDDGSPVVINLGAGSEARLHPNYVNVDSLPAEGIDTVHNLMEFPWPFDDGSADEIRAIDLIEHLPVHTRDYEPTLVKFVEEAHRILRPGGVLFMQTPHWQSPNLFIDPTHVRGFDERSFDYFDETTDLGRDYGYYLQVRFRVSAVRTPNDNVEFRMVRL